MLANRWFKILLALLVLVTCLILATPPLMKHFASQWLLENGGQQLQFDDIDFNPFTGTLILERLDMKVDDQTTLAFEEVSAGLAFGPLFDKQVAIDRVQLKGFTIVIDDRPEDALLVGGIRIPSGEPVDDTTLEDTPPSEWLAGVEVLLLEDVRIRYTDRQLDIQVDIDQLELDHLTQWTRQEPAELDASGVINGAPFSIQAELAPLADEPRYRGNFKLDKLPLEGFASLTAATLKGLAGQFSYDGEFEFTQKADGFRVKHQGDTRLEALDTRLKSPEIDIVSQAAGISGNLSLETTGDALDISLTADLQTSGLRLVAEENTLELMSADQLALKGVKLDGIDRLAIASLVIDKLSLGRSADSKSADAFMDVTQFEVTDIALADDLLSIDTVHYRGGHSSIRRTADGQLRIIGIIDSMRTLTEDEGAATETEPQQAAAATEPEAAPLNVSLGRMEVSGDSKISFVDETVEPPFKTVINLESILAEHLDTRKPEQHSPFHILGRIGKYTRLDFKGDMRPFQQPFGIDLKAEIEALDLPPLSAYTRQSLGLDLESGSLDTNTKLLINKQVMEGQIDLTLHQLQVRNVESENSLQSKIPVPLNVALDTLRDSNDTIELKIPIKGDPNDPSFDPNDAITKALAKGVEKGALTYLTFALQPYGALITAAKYAGEEFNKVRLKPVEFSAGLADIDKEDRDYLGKVANILKERPKIAIKLCGVAVEADRVALQAQAKPASGDKDSKAKEAKPATPAVSDEQLKTLAKARATAVKDFLVEQHSIPASHLVSCQPTLAADKDDAGPRTDLLI